MRFKPIKMWNATYYFLVVSDDLYFLKDHRLDGRKITKTVSQNDHDSSVNLFSLEIMLKHGMTWLWPSLEIQTRADAGPGVFS